jgi:hypothetical protein
MRASEKTRRTRRLSFLVAALLVAGVLGGGGWWYRSQPATVAGNTLIAPEKSSTLTLDPSAFAGKARRGYEVARRKPSLLAQLHCYCGCDKVLGHRNLLDCYCDKHAAKCATCLGEAIDSNEMNDQGSPIEQIRDALRARYEFAE